jgi:hypothetical protein
VSKPRSSSLSLAVEAKIFGGQGAGEIGERFSLPLLQLGRDVMHQEVAAPPMFDSCLDVPFPSRLVFEAVQQDHVVAPGQLCSKLLHNWLRSRPLRTTACI